MFESFKKKYRRKKLASRPVNIDRKLSFHNFRTAKNCLVFAVNGDVSMEELTGLSVILREHMEVRMLMLSEEVLPEEQRLEGVLYVAESEVTASGKMLNAQLEQTILEGVDLLIDLSIAPHGVGDYLLRSSRAKCKIGMGREGFRHDIIFEEANTVPVFQERLIGLLNRDNEQGI